MLSLFARSWNPIRIAPLQLFPTSRPYFRNPTAHVLTKFCSDTASQRLDEATITNFKRVVALRQEFLFRMAILKELALKLHMIRPKDPDLIPRLRKMGDLELEWKKILSEMCKTEFQRQAKRMEPKATKRLEQIHRNYSHKSHIFYRDLVPLILHFKALLDADATQQQPVLNIQERGTLMEVMKEYLEKEASFQRFMFWTFGVGVALSPLPVLWFFGCLQFRGPKSGGSARD